ncbi:MAG: imidazoleglycerol-phosphate dehydratase, partial [Terrimicrobiaceae bacterium]
MAREAIIERTTSETSIRARLNLDGEGASNVRSGIPFFDHMLTLFARHALFDLELDASGDIEVDFHHTVEDVGITLGQALTKAVGDKAGIRRYGFFYVPM